MKLYSIILITTFICCSSSSAEVLRFKDTHGVDKTIARLYAEISIENESFDYYTPTIKAGSGKPGLIVYIPPSDTFKIPASWKRICRDYNLALLAPRNIGNTHKVRRRIAVCVLGTLKAIKEGACNKNRVYLVGYSGDGRIASMIMF